MSDLSEYSSIVLHKRKCFAANLCQYYIYLSLPLYIILDNL